MATVIPAPPAIEIPVADQEATFPVRRIYCVGRNYAAHAREMGFDPDREPPFFFCKPADAIVANESALPFPAVTQNLHHEIELVVALQGGGVNIAEADAEALIYGYAVGLDMTRRDLQIQAREKGRPWDVGKAFDQSAPITAIHPAASVGHPRNNRIWLKVNGTLRQDSTLDHLIWNIPETISYLSGLFRLEPGDLIFTGTPEGVGKVSPGDKLEGGVEGVDTLTVRYLNGGS